MTFWAKLLTVIILVLSVIFAAVSALLYAKKTEWRAAYDDAVTAREAVEKKLNIKISGLEKDLTTVRSERDSLRNDLTTTTAKLNEAGPIKARLEADIKDKSATINTIAARVTYLEAEQKKWEERLDAMRNRRDELENQVRDLATRLQAGEEENKELADAKRALTEELQQTKEKLNNVGEALAANERVLSYLYERYDFVRPIIDDRTFPVPRIYGKVVAVDEQHSNVIINVGTRAGVKRDYKFTVYRNGQFKGRVRIFELEGEDLAAGKVEVLASDEKGTPRKIEVGDDVATSIGF